MPVRVRLWAPFYIDMTKSLVYYIDMMMNNLPNISGWFKAADTILGNLNGMVILGIIILITFFGVGILFAAFFSIATYIGLTIEISSIILIGVLSIISVALLFTIIILSTKL